MSGSGTRGETPRPVFLEIGGVAFSLRGERGIALDRLPRHYPAFLREREDPSAVPVSCRIAEGGGPDPALAGKEVFRTGSAWTLFRDGADYVVNFIPPALSGRILWTARFPRDLSRIEILVSPEPAWHPFTYPLDQIVVMYLLARRGGLILHAACGVGDGGGAIFLGRSGAGKSTVSRLLQQSGDWRFLSDDRVIVRAAGEGIVAHGTPWPGEGAIAVQERVPARRLYFLRQDTICRLRRLTAPEALERLLPLASIPWYDGEVLGPLLDFGASLAARVPAFELSFPADGTLAAFLADHDPA